jgi:hypothetical protein
MRRLLALPLRPRDGRWFTRGNRNNSNSRLVASGTIVEISIIVCPAGGLAHVIGEDKSSDGLQIYLRNCRYRWTRSFVRRNDAGRADGLQWRAESVYCQLHKKHRRFRDRSLHRQLQRTSIDVQADRLLG